MGLFDNILWLGQFSLELAGAVLFYRRFRDLRLVWLYLGLRAAAEVVVFGLRLLSAPGDPWAAWRWANYWQQIAQYILMAILAMRGIGAAVNSDERTVRQYGLLAGFMGLVAVAIIHGAAPWDAVYLLKICVGANLVLVILLAGALLARELEVITQPMEEPWSLLCWGLAGMVSVQGMALFLLVQGRIGGLLASRIDAAGQLLALGLWLFAATRKKAEIVQADAAPRFQPQSAQFQEENKWVM